MLACHSDQSLRLLGSDASADERAVLGAIRYHPNRAVLHTDEGQLPQRRKAWAAWNYEHAGDAGRERSGVCLHYLLNRLQPMPWTQPVIVSLNPVRQIRREHILGEYDYSHPVFDLAAIEASTHFANYFLQPMDNAQQSSNIAACIEQCMQRPGWRLSLQTHKLTGIR